MVLVMRRPGWALVSLRAACPAGREPCLARGGLVVPKNDTNSRWDVFLHHRVNGRTRLLGVAADRGSANA